jgi:hypothetical protein
MAKVTLQNGLLSLGARGKFGKPNGLGEIWLGWSELGEDNIRAGYYQYHWNQRGKYFNKARFYWNPPHTTEAAIAWKTVFAGGVQAWKDLTDEERLAYNRLKYPTAQSGFTRFMSKYLKDHV